MSARTPLPPAETSAIAPARLGQTDVFGLGSAAVLEMARDYVLLGRVHQPRQRGCRLAAEVEGTADTYACHADVTTADGAAQIAPHCECPSHRPYCKHVLALLLLWAAEPSAFAPLDAWEARLRDRPAEELAALLADLAMRSADPVAALREAMAPGRWTEQPPGRALERWPSFAAEARAEGRWPEAALEVGLRIAGPPGGAVRVRPDAQSAVTMRHLAWWLTLAAASLPPPALLPWVDHLRAHLEAAAAGGDPRALPPELGVWLARLAAVLPAERSAARLWLARFAAAAPTLSGVMEAELQTLLWGAELTARLAVAPATLAPDAGSPTAARCRDALAALAAERGAPGASVALT